MFTKSLSYSAPKRLAVKLTNSGERSLRSGHPWIFSESIEKVNFDGVSGDIAIIFSHTKNKVIGVGLYDSDSPIRIKVLHHEGAVNIDTDFFSEKVYKALALRFELLKTRTNSYRLIFGENDGFPGFIADVYADVLVVKLYSTIWLPYLDKILKLLIEVSETNCVVLRLSRKLQGKDSLGLKDGEVLFGELATEVIEFEEHGVRFSANVIKGHKTGYFLDHRANRKRVGELSKGKSVLDVFAYTGGFSVHALANGATEVTSLDISNQALEVALANGMLNTFSGKHNIIAGDAFEMMKKLIREKRTFDIVVIDPPSFAKSVKEIDVAKKKYTQLAQLGNQLTVSGGVLILASCSSRVSVVDFLEANKSALSEQARSFTLSLVTEHDIDHPVSFPEGSYLKCAYYQIH